MKKGRFKMLIIFCALSVVGGYFYWQYRELPKVQTLRSCFKTTLHGVDLCSKSGSYVKLNNISVHLKQAVIVSEDSSFYYHEGFDFEEIKSSLSTNFKARKWLRGASTISQQLVKNAFLNSEKSLLRKAKEALLTYHLEKSFTKDQILELYLNVVEWGPKIFGIRQAARYYFNKVPDDLEVLESAFLAFLLPNPKKYQVSFQKGALTRFARKRVKDICRKLYLHQRISREVFNQTLREIDDFPWNGKVDEELEENETEDEDTEEEFEEGLVI